MQNPKIAALVFGSGKVVLTGAKSVDSLSKGLTILGNQTPQPRYRYSEKTYL